MWKKRNVCPYPPHRLILLRSWGERLCKWTQESQVWSVKDHRVPLDHLALELNGDWYVPQRIKKKKMMFALFSKMPSMVHWWPTVSSAARGSRRWEGIITIKRIIWCKRTQRCSRESLRDNHPSLQFTDVASLQSSLWRGGTQPPLLGLSQTPQEWMGLGNSNKSQQQTHWRCGRYTALILCLAKRE